MRSLNLTLTWYLTTVWSLIFVLTLLFQLSTLKFTTLNLAPKYQLYTTLPPYQSIIKEGDLTQDVSWTVEDSRLLMLTRFFKTHKSKLVGNSSDFIKAADKYQTDYKLLAAIAVYEEDAALKKYNNPFGYRTLDKKYVFYDSVEESIDKFAAVLKTDFLDPGLKTPEEIQPGYTSIQSNNRLWSDKITSLMKQLK